MQKIDEGLRAELVNLSSAMLLKKLAGVTHCVASLLTRKAALMTSRYGGDRIENQPERSRAMQSERDVSKLIESVCDTWLDDTIEQYREALGGCDEFDAEQLRADVRDRVSSEFNSVWRQ